MTGHCTDGADQGTGAISLITRVVAVQEVEFSEEHVDRMYPGEIQLEEMMDENLTVGDLGPLTERRIDTGRLARNVIEIFDSRHDVEDILPGAGNSLYISL